MDGATEASVCEGMKRRNPYDTAPREKRGRIARAGMSLIETVVWVAIMAVLSVGMIWLLWTTSR